MPDMTLHMMLVWPYLPDLALCCRFKQMMQAETFGDDNVKVINNEHEQYSVIRLGGSYGPGALLQIASAMTGVGVSIHEAVIQVCKASTCAGVLHGAEQRKRSKCCFMHVPIQAKHWISCSMGE